MGGFGWYPAGPRAVSSAGERPPHTREVTGSIPVLPTSTGRLRAAFVFREGAQRRSSCWPRNRATWDGVDVIRLVCRAGWKYLHLLPSGLPSEDTRDCSCPCTSHSCGGRDNARATPSGRGWSHPRHRGPRSIRKCSVKPRRPGVRALRICRGTRSTVWCHAGNGACRSCRAAQHRSGRYHARCDTWISHCHHDARAGRCLQAGQRYSGPGTCDRFHGGCPAIEALRRT